MADACAFFGRVRAVGLQTDDDLTSGGLVRRKPAGTRAKTESSQA